MIDLLVRNLRAQADHQAQVSWSIMDLPCSHFGAVTFAPVFNLLQVESIVILATLSAHKPLASRLIASGVHLAALDLLPRVVSATAIVPITIGSLEVSTNGLPAIGLSTAEQLTNRDREAMLAARTQRSSISEGSAHERGAASQTVTGEGDGGAPSKKDPKLVSPLLVASEAIKMLNTCELFNTCDCSASFHMLAWPGLPVGIPRVPARRPVRVWRAL